VTQIVLDPIIERAPWRAQPNHRVRQSKSASPAITNAKTIAQHTKLQVCAKMADLVEAYDAPAVNSTLDGAPGRIARREYREGGCSTLDQDRTG